MTVKVLVKTTETSLVPRKAYKGDAGFDLVATDCETSGSFLYPTYKYSTGISVEIPEGYVGLLYPRSSICKYGLRLANSVGVIDSGYRGEIKAIFKSTSLFGGRAYNVGDKVAQLVIMKLPEVELEEVSELGDSERDVGGFGSSGN